MSDDRFVMQNGKHAGEPITRVPPDDLKWMVNAGHRNAEEAAKEMERRGTVTPTLDLSGHAIDRASLRLWRQYKETRSEGEGLWSWLARIAAKALDGRTPDEQGRVNYAGIRFVFATEGKWPVLKSVMPLKNGSAGG
ncbi:MAG: hypothetical protein WBG86_14525 [Polyangiales bacterium]